LPYRFFLPTHGALDHEPGGAIERSGKEHVMEEVTTLSPTEWLSVGLLIVLGMQAVSLFVLSIVSLRWEP
jgi:hypothetical protein